MKNELNRNKGLFIIILFYLLISITVYLYLKDSFYLLICWNIFLAMVPLFISTLLSVFQKLNKVSFILLSFLWLLFFPNTTYVITDFIHLQGLTFYQKGTSVVYFENFAGWAKLLHTAFGAFLGVFLGMKSLGQMHDLFSVKLKKQVLVLFLILTFLVSGYGTYVGRFLRFNSWDIFLPIAFFETIIDNLNIFTLYFSIIYGILIAGLYGLYRNIIVYKN
ncbi:MAG: DUF1361 domain-containing protein [Bacilli bacterium]|nr:DUF1361 domain-containing protein [Bacilli bacterium]